MLLRVATSLEEKRFFKLVSSFTFVLVSNHGIHCYLCSLGLLRFVTSCYVFRREKVCETSFQVHFCISFQSTNTLLLMFIGLSTCCFQLLNLQKRKGLSNQFQGSLLYQFPTHDYFVIYLHWACYVLLPVATSIEDKSFVKLFLMFPFVLVFNQRLPSYIFSLGLLHVVTSCYIFRRKYVCKSIFQVHFCISFQPPNTLLNMFIGLDPCCFQLLHLQKRKDLSNQFPDSLLYQFPITEYLVTYVHWACYVLFPAVTSLEEKIFFTSSHVHFCISFQPLTTLLYMSIGLVTCCYQLLHLQKIKVLSNQFPGSLFISFQPPNILLNMFIGLVTCCYQLLHLQKIKGLSNQFSCSLLYQFPTNEYVVTYVHWACYVLFPVVKSLEEKRFVKLVSRFTFVLVSNSRISC